MWIDDTSGKQIETKELSTYLEENVDKDSLLELIGKYVPKNELMDLARMTCDSIGVDFMSELSFEKQK